MINTNKALLATFVSLVYLDGFIFQEVPHSRNIVLPEDGRLDFTGFAKRYGVQCEVFNVTTEDGYILKLFHIPGNNKLPVFAMHGVFDAADTFILRGNSSMALALNKEGYDVWVGNARGNRYSRRHKKLNPDTDTAFWNYSFHEIGYYDLPAMIDFILDKTGASSLSAIGHSQGNQVFYVLGSSRPEYNKKINVLIALAPICYVHNVSPPVNGIVALGPLLDEFLKLLGREEIFGDTSIVRSFLDQICLQGSGGLEVCVEGLFFMLAGRDTKQFEPEFSRIAIAHYPTGTSRTNMEHLLQVAQKREFAFYDHGADKNLAVYNSSVVPTYDLSKVTMKVALIAAKNDRLSSLRDVKILRKRLRNIVNYKVIEYPMFNHLDYVWGKYMRRYLFPHLFKILRTYGRD